MDNYVTYLAGSSARCASGGERPRRANLAEFTFFKEQGAFSRDSTDGTYRVDFARMQAAINAFSEKVLTLQGNGDYAGWRLPAEGRPDGHAAQAGPRGLATADIPTDIVFKQGMEVLQAAPKQ